MRKLVVGFALIVAAVAGASGQSYPDRPIKIIAPFTPGSPNDVVARLIAPPLSMLLGQSVVIDNRPGGGTAIGIKAVTAADPDGYTLLISNSPTHFITPLVNKSFSYDPLKDFVPVASIASGGLMLVIAPEVPATTIKEFVAYAKTNPGKLNFGFGQGTLPQLVGEMFKLATGTEFAFIPYKGGIQAVTDILGGRVQMNIGTDLDAGAAGAAGQAARAGHHQRSAQSRDAGGADHGGKRAAGGGVGDLLRPVRTGRHPDEAVRRVNAAVNDSLKSPELQAAIAASASSPMAGRPSSSRRCWPTRSNIWAPIVQKTGFQMN